MGGVGFEQNRTHDRMGNNAVYAWQGLKTLTLLPAPLVSDVVEELAIAAGDKSPGEWVHCARIGFGEDSSGAVARIAGRSADLMFLNVPSFAGGANPWAWAVREQSPEPVEPVSQQQGNARQALQAATLEDLWAESRAEVKAVADEEARALDMPETCDQSFGDGRLEVLTYSTGLGAAADAANSKVRMPGRGAGQRLASAHGPFVINFKPPSEAQYTSPDGEVFFQVDGEFFVAKQPQQVVVRHFRTVRVLCHPEAVG